MRKTATKPPWSRPATCRRADMRSRPVSSGGYTSFGVSSTYLIIAGGTQWKDCEGMGSFSLIRQGSLTLAACGFLLGAVGLAPALAGRAGITQVSCPSPIPSREGIAP
jgi:hypothetical protein